MKNLEVVNLFRIIESLADKTGASPQFSYALVRNKHLLKPVFDALVEAGRVSVEFATYDKERVALCARMAQKGANGQPVLTISGKDYVIPAEDHAEFDNQMADLQGQHKAAIAANKELTAKVEALMENDAEELTLIRLPLSAFPPDITVRQMEALLPIVDPGESIVHELAPQV